MGVGVDAQTDERDEDQAPARDSVHNCYFVAERVKVHDVPRRVRTSQFSGPEP